VPPSKSAGRGAFIVSLKPECECQITGFAVAAGYVCEFACVLGFDIKRLFSAYGSLCARWVNERVPGPARGAHQRFFQAALAMPLCAAFAAPAALMSGMTLQTAFAALAALLGAGLALAAFVSLTGRLRAGLFTMAALTGGAFSLITPFSGVLTLLPLALLTGAETLIVTRKPVSAIAAAALAVAACAALSGMPAAQAAPLTLLALALVHLASLALRAAPHDKAEPAATPLSERLMDAAGIVRAKMILTGEITAVEGCSSDSFNICASMLEGFGLFGRIPVGERLAYLSALDAVRAGGERSEALIRLTSGGSQGAFIHARAVFCRLPDGLLGLSLQRVDAPAAAPQPVTEDTVRADNYLAGVSHELRTPLNAILGFSDILQQEMFGPLANERQREYVGLIHQSGAHLLEVVNMILDVSKLDAGAYHIVSEPFDVEDAVSVSAAMVRGQAASKGVALEFVTDKAAAECVGDRRAVQQILINLLSNAVKFTPKGGSVKLSAAAEDGCLALTVADTGIGMCGSDLAKIGQPFFQAQNEYTRAFEGTGLGLSLVRGLVELHGGGLAVESELGAGTSVTVRLPLNGPSGAGRGQTVNLSEKRQAAALPLRLGARAQGVGHEPAIRKTA
jgi:two-component system, cell cycle sensor histidine kinase DivJ